jgi:hypothetical protein
MQIPEPTSDLLLSLRAEDGTQGVTYAKKELYH